jgi:hypothetical protein
MTEETPGSAEGAVAEQAGDTQDKTAAKTSTEGAVAEAPKEGAQDQPGQSDDGGASGDEPERRRSRGGFQRKIEKLSNERDYWRDEALKHAKGGETAKTQEQPKQQASKAPNPDDFASHEDYQNALIDYRADQRLEQKLQQREREEREQRLREQRNQTERTYGERVQAFIKNAPDFMEVLEESDAPMTDGMKDVIIESEFGPEIVYALAKNPNKAFELSKLGPTALNRAIGRMEAELEAGRRAANGGSGQGKTNGGGNATHGEKKVTKSPEPFKPVNAGGSADPGAYNPNWTQKQYEEWRARGGGR